MATTKFLIGTAVAAVIALGATGCASSTPSDDDSAPAAGEITTLTVGATAPADAILNFAQSSGQAEEAGITIDVTVFTDYTTPNTALEGGDVDANLYQHLPFLKNFNATNGTHIAPVGKVYFPALALYSKTLDDVADIEDGATISIPNDPTNELRSLDLLEEAGLITVKEGATGILSDIEDNPKNLKFQELDAATLPRALDENAAGIVNLTFALPAGLTGEEQLFVEDVEGTPYTNLLATKEGEEDNPSIQALYEVLTSQETQDWILEEYKGLVIPASGAAE